MVLKKPKILSSSHSAVKRSATVALDLLLSRAATRPTLTRTCSHIDLYSLHELRPHGR